jgi:hypothetical protein
MDEILVGVWIGVVVVELQRRRARARPEIDLSIFDDVAPDDWLKFEGIFNKI